MSEGLTYQLGLSALLIAALCCWIASRQLHFGAALLSTAVRVGLPVVYFAWYNDGAWYMFDDVFYLDNGLKLHDWNYSVLDVITTVDGRERLQSLHGGSHMLYTVWNLLAISIFGPYYWAPILLNVLVTFLTAHVFVRTLQELGFGKSYCSVAHIFVLLHWDMVAWSSVINCKDPLVQLVTVVLLHCVLRLSNTHRARYAVIGIGAVALFYWLRFYIPFLVTIAIGLWILSQWRHLAKYPILAAMLIGFFYLLPKDQRSYELMSASGIVRGVAPFLLKPIPWNLGESYTFLTVPSVLHWTLFLPMILGATMLWRNSPGARFYLLYAAVIVLFYSATDELLGTRHRLQISVILAWAQFHFLWSLVYSAVPNLRGPSRNAGAPAGAILTAGSQAAR